MGELHQNTVVGTNTLEHSGWENYFSTQQIDELHQNTVDRRNTLEDSRSHIRTQQTGQLLQNTVDCTLGHSKQDS